MKKLIEVKLDDDTKLIAHRGLSGIAPENTVQAFELAGKYGYFGVECDIHVTKDREFVVFHDFTLERMTNSKGFIKELNVDEIKQINITSGNCINEFENVKIPLLSEYIDICIKYKMCPVIEIKDVIDMNDLDKLIEFLLEKNILFNCIIISFNINYLIYLKMKVPQLSIQYLVDKITDEVISACKEYQFNVDCNYHHVTEENIKLCHENKILVNAYTVDDPNIAEELNNYGVDFITTNILNSSTFADELSTSHLNIS